MNSPLISIVSPVYQAEAIVGKLVQQLVSELSKLTENFEIILVEDHSPDQSWEEIFSQCNQDRRVKGIKLSRNFGQHKAIAAGLHFASGQWIVVMDCDLQDRPQEISALYSKALEGFQIVQARRVSRQDNALKRFFSKVFYKILGYFTDTKFDPAVANFGIYSKVVIDQINKFPENFRFFPLFIKWVGFKATSIAVEHQERDSGKSSYNLKRLAKLALDVIIAFSDKPLRLIVKFGFLTSFAALVFGVYLLIRAVFGDYSVSGWPSLMISIWFLAGTIILIQGVVGLYVGKTFEETKKRPLYIVDLKINT